MQCSLHFRGGMAGFVAPDQFYLVGGTRNGSFDSEGC